MMLLYAKIFLEIKRRGKLNIGRYSSHNSKSRNKNQEQSNLQLNNEATPTVEQTSIKPSKSLRLKERLSEKLSLRDDKLRKDGSIKEVSFSTKSTNKKDTRSRATWNGSNSKRKMLLVASSSTNTKNVIPKVDLCIECDQKDQVSNSLIKNKESEMETQLNNGETKEKVKEEDLEQNDDQTKGDDKDDYKELETTVAKQKYQQLTILSAGNIESQLKEIKTLDNVKVEVQIVTAPDDDETAETSKIEDAEINDKEVIADENSNLNKSSMQKEDLFQSKIEIEPTSQKQQERRLSVKKWFLLPKVTVYLQKNLQLDRRRRKGKLKNRRKSGDSDGPIEDSPLSTSKLHKDKENVLDNGTELKSIDSVADKFNQKSRKRKALRSLLWLRKMKSSTDLQTPPDQTSSLETPVIALKKRIENDETGSLSFDFSSSVPRSLEDLPTSTSMQPSTTTARPTFIQGRLLPFSCSSSSLRINRSNLAMRSNQPQSIQTNATNLNETSTRASLINRTLNRNTLTKSTINIPSSTSVMINNEPINTHCLSINRSQIHQPNHSLSLHLPSTSSTSVNQNSILTNSSDYLTTQSNQSSFYLSRIESSRLKQEKKAALQLGLIMGGFLVRTICMF